jgi:hypothetical protein
MMKVMVGLIENGNLSISLSEKTPEKTKKGGHSIRRMLSQKTKEVVGVIQGHNGIYKQKPIHRVREC